MNRAAKFILLMCFATVLAIVAGTLAVFGFTQILEPMYAGFGEPAASLDWGEPGANVLKYASFSFMGMFLVILLFFVYSPIQDDVRQEVR